MSDKDPVIIDGITGELETLPPQKGKRYRCQLETMNDVKREMAKVYRECRSEVIEAQTATKQVWILQAVAKVIESSDFEKRLETLENTDVLTKAQRDKIENENYG